MSSRALTIRPANPTNEDGVFFARFMNMAADGAFRKMFGPRFEEIVTMAYLRPNHDLSCEYAVFAEIDGVVVGMASGYTAEQHARFSDVPLKEAAGRDAFRIACILTLIAPMWRFLHTYDDSDFYLQFLAVDAAHRRKGIGASLIQAMESRGRECGATRFALDVSGRNPDAKHLYERQGLHVRERWPRLRWLPAAVLRMTKPL
jgi:ribosomal protein S18 acetylase RimI-like enzyme